MEHLVECKRGSRARGLRMAERNASDELLVRGPKQHSREVKIQRIQEASNKSGRNFSTRLGNGSAL